MGQVLQAGAGQIPARQAAVEARHPDDRARAHHQQGLPVRHRRHRAGRPADPGRRVRDRRRRRHGVDDPGAAPAAEVPRGLEVRRRRSWSTPWPTTVCSDAFDRPRRWARPPRRATPSSASPREEQDEFSARSHQRAAAAWKNGLFDDEIAPVEIPQRKGDPVVVHGRRGHPRRHDRRVARQAAARRSRKDGTITAGSSSQISDGAAAVVVMSKAKAEELGLTWLAEIGAHGVVAGPDSSLQSQPAARDRARRCAKEGIEPGGPRPHRDQRGVRRRRHRVDARPRRRPRTRSTSTAARSRSATRSACPAPGSRCTSRSSCKRRGGGVGAAALCGGGGQGDALIVRVPGRPADRVARRAARRPTSSRGPAPATPRAVARLISLVEDASPLLREVMAALAPLRARRASSG